jgi:hypothetical protein
MKKKMYEKPTTKVYELKQQPQILAGSLGATRGDVYGTAIEDTWEE